MILEILLLIKIEIHIYSNLSTISLSFSFNFFNRKSTKKSYQYPPIILISIKYFGHFNEKFAIIPTSNYLLTEIKPTIFENLNLSM